VQPELLTHGFRRQGLQSWNLNATFRADQLFSEGCVRERVVGRVSPFQKHEKFTKRQYIYQGGLAAILLCEKAGVRFLAIGAIGG